MAGPGVGAWRLLLAIQIVAVCVLAFDPHPPAAAEALWDKANHLLAFAAMAFSASRGWRWHRRSAAVIAAALIGFGAFIELVQTTIPGRSGEWPDLLADAAGIAIGLAAALGVRRLARR